MHEGLTKTVGDILLSHSFPQARSEAEAFAIKRFAKKLEIPDKERAKERRAACFTSYIEHDSQLRAGRLPGAWYKARLQLHEWLRGFELGAADFTSGSETSTNAGLGSVEDKLGRSAWTCSRDCFELWARCAWSHRSVRRATKDRFKAVVRGYRDWHVATWDKCKNLEEPGFQVFRLMLAHVTHVVEHSRFSTVRKNNAEDRSIDLQSFPHMLVQRSIGVGIRDLLKRETGVDLLVLAEEHRIRVADQSIATIDLRKASDSVSLWLCEFNLPKWFYQMLVAARPSYLQGLDGNFYILNKMSSMGVGFTFELMSMLLLAITRVYDPTATVFGDDIITSKATATDVIEAIEAAGFVVNVDKTYINGPFRESCGANYYDGYGYVESFDFEYPVTINDAMILVNKVKILSTVYDSFKVLLNRLTRVVPKALRGPELMLHRERGSYLRVDIPSEYFAVGKYEEVDTPAWCDALRADGYDIKPKGFSGVAFLPHIVDPPLPHLSRMNRTYKYSMYLHAGARVPRLRKGKGSWTTVRYVILNGMPVRVSQLRHDYDSRMPKREKRLGNGTCT